MHADFHLLEFGDKDSRWTYACHLVETLWLDSRRVFIWCNSQEDAEKIDELLWTFRLDSFIPHNLQGEGPEPPPPVHIGYSGVPRGFNDVLVNMADSLPDFYPRFRQTIEIIPQDEERKALSRTNYRRIKSAGHSIQMQTLTALSKP